MNALPIIVALAVALVTAAGAAVAVARVRMAADERVAGAVRSLAEGMQETIRGLAEAAETAQTAPTGERFVEELAASLDLDEVAARTVEAATALPGVEGARLEAAGLDGNVVTASFGLLAEEAGRSAVRLPDNDNLRTVEVGYRYRLDDVDASAAVVRSAVVVPLRADGEPIGSLSAFSRSPTSSLTDDAVEQLERLAFRAGPALDNARRFGEARSLADHDALTGLNNHRYFHQMLEREVARAHRYARQLSLIVFDLDDFKSVNDRVGHLSGDTVLAEIATRVRSVVRTADIPCRIGGDEFAVLLPESEREEAELLADRIAAAVRARPIGQAGMVQISAGVAELRAGEDATGLFKRADDALYRAKQLGKARTVAASDGV